MSPTQRHSHPGLGDTAFLLRLVEPCIVFLSSVVVFALRHATFDIPARYVGMTLMAAMGYAVFATLTGYYQSTALRRVTVNILRLVAALAAMFALVVVMLFVFKVSSGFSRLWLVGWLASSFLTILCLRLWVSVVIKRKLKAGEWRRRIAVLGTGPKATEVIRVLSNHDEREFQLVGFYTLDEEDVSVDSKRNDLYQGPLKTLIKHGLANMYDELIVAVDMDSVSRPGALLNQLHKLSVNVMYCMPLPFFGRVNSQALNGSLPLVVLFHRPLEGHTLWLKRALDVLASSFALLLAAPAMLVVAILIKITSPGPVFFRQMRDGFNGEQFEMLKFRSMRAGEAPKDADGKEKQATKDDPRITRIGRFIRKTSLDELPQLINVLRGDMSLVGPRPHAPSHNNHYEALIEKYASRHKIRPGLTGWAQLNGWRGETDTIEKMQKRVEFDIWYIENWSLGLDLKIIFMTPLVLLFQRGAY